MAAKINWHRYGTKLRHCYPMHSDRQHSGMHRRRLVVISIAASPYSHSRSLSLIAPSFHPPLSSFPCPFSSAKRPLIRMSMEALLPLPAVSAEGICSWDVFWRVFRLQLKCLLSDDSNFEYAHCWTSCRRHDEIGWRRRAHRYRPTTPWLDRTDGGTMRYDTRCYFDVRSKANVSRLKLPHGTNI